MAKTSFYLAWSICLWKKARTTSQRGLNILIISLYLKFCIKIRPFWLFGHPVLLKWPCISLFHPYFRKVTTYTPQQKGKLFSRPNILIISLYLICLTKIRPFLLFEHPVWLKWPCISLVYPFLKKGTTNAPHHKGKNFHEIKYFDHILISPFLHQNKAILIFWTPCIA